MHLLADQVFWQQTNAAYAALCANPEMSVAFDAELAEWDATLLDGLEGLEWVQRHSPNVVKFGSRSLTRRVGTSRPVRAQS